MPLVLISSSVSDSILTSVCVAVMMFGCGEIQRQTDRDRDREGGRKHQMYEYH